MFDKSAQSFAIKDKTIFLNSCGVSPLYAPACDRAMKVLAAQRDEGMGVWFHFGSDIDDLHENAARVLRTSPDNISCVPSTAFALSLIANGYPFKPGDEVISYVHEFPSNHYPWRIQEKLRDVKLVLLPDSDCGSGAAPGRPRGWTMEDLEKAVTPRTRLIAVSHVQFASGFAADLKELGNFCFERGIDLVIDAAQSIGVLPIYPEEWHISAVAASGWKWLMGPLGAALMYTSEEFRRKLDVVMGGPDMMQQRTDYLNHTWNVYEDGRRFEFSTLSLDCLAALNVCLKDLFVAPGIEAVSREAARLRGKLLSEINRTVYRPVMFQAEHQSGIMAFDIDGDVESLVKVIGVKGVTCSTRGGYLRLAPHFYVTDEEIEKAVKVLNSIGA